MKQKLSFLAVVAVLAAMAVPGYSAAATVTPSGAQFEIPGGAHPPTITAYYGSCTISSITGQLNGTGSVPVTLTPGSCSSGTTISFVGQWTLNASSTVPGRVVLQGGLIMKFSLLPQCRLLTSGKTSLAGVWANGFATPKFVSTEFHPNSSARLYWANNETGTCSSAGRSEQVTFNATGFSFGNEVFPELLPVKNLTSPESPVLIAP